MLAHVDMKWIIILLILSTGCTSVPHKSGTTERYAVPALPHRAVIADFDMNGWPDIAIASKYSDATVFLNPGKPDNPFPINLKAYFQPISLAAGDINGDGIPDIIPMTETLVGPVFISDGKGNFTKKDITLHSPPFATFIEAFDINSDGFDDLVASGTSGTGPYIYLNRQNLSFETINVPLRAIGSAKVQAGKTLTEAEGDDVRFVSHHLSIFHRDGKGETGILVPDELKGSVWLIQHKKNHFDPVELVNEKDSIATSAASYFSGNGTTVIAAFHKHVLSNLVFLKDGSSPFAVIERITLPGAVQYIAAADMDKDGKEEIVCLILRDMKLHLSVYKQNIFDKPAFDLPVSGPLSFAIGDIDQDGFPDLVIPDYKENTLTIVYSPLRKK